MGRQEVVEAAGPRTGMSKDRGLSPPRAPVGAEDGRERPVEEKRPGDWECPMCHVNVYATR